MQPRSAEQKALFAVGLAIVVGLILRLFHLDERTISHPEFFVPALNFPDFVDSPRARFTVLDVLREALSNDKHPPGYYLLQLAWNLNLGTELFRIRLSSVLYGTLGLAAVAWYVRVNRGSGFGALAAWLLALHGFHILWSQQARMWVLVGTLGILTSAILVKLVRRPGVAAMLAYGLLAGLGAWTEYYFWPILCAQILWVVLRELDQPRVPLSLGGIGLAAIIATPLAIYLWVHLTEQASHLQTLGWNGVLRFLQFDGIIARSRLQTALNGFAVPVEAAVTILGVATMGLGLPGWSNKKQDSVSKPHIRTSTVFVILTVFAILMSLGTWFGFRSMVGDRKIFRAALIGPFLVLAGWALLQALWRSMAPRVVRLPVVQWVRRVLADPVAVIPLAAAAGLMAVAAVLPVFARFGMVCYTPFMVVIAARGVERMGRWRLPVGAAVFAVFLASVWQYGTTDTSPRDYRGLGLMLADRVEPTQVVVMRNTTENVPVTYYLPTADVRIVPISRFPDARPLPEGELTDTIWLVEFGEAGSLAEAQRFVPTFEQVEQIRIGGGVALQMIRNANGEGG